MPGLRPRVAPGRPGRSRRSRYRWKATGLGRVPVLSRQQAGRQARREPGQRASVEKKKLKSKWPTHNQVVIPYLCGDDLWKLAGGEHGHVAERRPGSSPRARQAGRLGVRASRGGRLPASCGTVGKLLVLAGSPYRAGRKAGRQAVARCEPGKVSRPSRVLPG